MKILFIDNESIQNSIRIGLLEQMAHHDVHLCHEHDDVMSYYNEHKPDMVLIDFSIESGAEILKEILELMPTQPIITISDSIDCSELLGCEFCLKNYDKKRVLKHQGIQELLYLIDNFEDMHCEHAHNISEDCGSKEKNAG